METDKFSAYFEPIQRKNQRKLLLESNFPSSANRPPELVETGSAGTGYCIENRTSGKLKFNVPIYPVLLQEVLFPTRNCREVSTQENISR
jgi:hypothetical protein